MKTSLRILGVGIALSTITGTSSADDADLPFFERQAPPTMTSIAGRMDIVVGSLAETVTGEPTQKDQKKVLRNLDQLIAALEKECQACRNGIASNRPSKPMQDSNIHGGTGGIGDLADPGASEKEWAKLTPRERDRILQSMSEGFPPEYRTVLERYYRRLAEEKSATSRETQAEAPADSSQAP